MLILKAQQRVQRFTSKHLKELAKKLLERFSQEQLKQIEILEVVQKLINGALDFT